MVYVARRVLEFCGSSLTIVAVLWLILQQFIHYIRQVNGVNGGGYTVMLAVLLSFCAQSINRLRRHCCTASVNLFAR